MNGNRYLLDTNAIIALLQGNKTLLQQLRNCSLILPHVWNDARQK